ncbi:lytic transglycosylase domain-containing protein [Paracoccus litorisediminis]|uniref:lytic transglycosylase domain-containing protein n=1 Tax=Paracoccus litorisediminis TaxID=2006130 RepID=UPI00372E3810
MQLGRILAGAALMVQISRPAWAWQDLYSAPDPDPPSLEAVGSAELMVEANSSPLSGLEDGIPSLSGLSKAQVERNIGADALSLALSRATQSGVAAPLSGMGDPRGICIAAIMAAEEKYGIPNDLLLAIGLQEAGTRRNGQITIWPWVVNSEGTGHQFESRDEAVAFVRREHAMGRMSTDIGCLQINTRWHPEAFKHLEDGFDPVRNAEYAAEYLLELHAETGDWMRAAGNYHSRTYSHHERYRAGVLQNLQVVSREKANLLQLASLVQETIIAKNRVEDADAIGQDQDLRMAALRPGAYRRQMEHLRKVEAATRSSTRQLSALPGSATEPPLPTAGPWWSAELSAAKTGGSSRSIYSGEDIEPVLPELTQGG